jgi:hypothetical protein
MLLPCQAVRVYESYGLSACHLPCHACHTSTSAMLMCAYEYFSKEMQKSTRPQLTRPLTPDENSRVRTHGTACPQHSTQQTAHHTAAGRHSLKSCIDHGLVDMGRPRTASDPDGLIRFLRAGGRAGGRRDTSAAAVGPCAQAAQMRSRGGPGRGMVGCSALGWHMPPPPNGAHSIYQ